MWDLQSWSKTARSARRNSRAGNAPEPFQVSRSSQGVRRFARKTPQIHADAASASVVSAVNVVSVPASHYMTPEAIAAMASPRRSSTSRSPGRSLCRATSRSSRSQAGVIFLRAIHRAQRRLCVPSFQVCGVSARRG